jgi:hypothetical protein
MRSLWRFMASQWLGGEGSEALSGDSALIDLLLPAPTAPSFRVVRSSQARAFAISTSPASDAAEREKIAHPAPSRT